MNALRISRRAMVAGMAAAPFVPALARAAGTAVGAITRFDPALDALIDTSAPIEVLGTGYKWAEGPTWVPYEDYLLFSDVPSNICWKWKPGEGTSKFLDPSGLAGPVPPEIREAGSNGLVATQHGQLLMADSGTRCIAAVDLETKEKTVLAGKYQGKRFNSCNDLVVHAFNGSIYFTDPPYGLRDGDRSSIKELDFNGVFIRDPNHEIRVIAKDLSRPNGIGLSPDCRTLYVAMSDEKRPQVLAYPLDEDGELDGEPKVFADFSAELAKKLPGLPDGLKVARTGHVFATGPGGVHVLSPEGKRLGLIATGKAIANCGFGGADRKTLFLTSHDILASVPLKIAALPEPM